ncbi:MAG: MFS transporter [Rubrimonas sp.]|uniref:MFS transporter n=1 Tax=Rubrimonas sp. TaxID=2036015 RepID=UPI002FDD9D00
MLAVLRDSWALLFGILLLMLGNGLQGTLLGVRGAMEGMGAQPLSFVMSAYFLGFLIGAKAAPEMIRRVGHVRVFAALASLISAAFILYAAIPDPWVWIALRLLVGFCFCGVYVVAESWLNDRATNETRGQALSAYMMMQMIGIVGAQAFLVLADPGGYTLFVLISVLISVSFAPILLSVTPAPVFQTTRRMTLRELIAASPLGCFTAFALGGVYAALFGMIGVYGVEAGLTVPQISILAASIYIGGMAMIWPVGYASDRMDRRKVIVALCAMGSIAGLAGAVSGFWGLVAAAAVIGGAVNPLYSLAIAHTNDYLQPEDMAASSAGLLFLNGVGAVGGPILVGLLMAQFGPSGFFHYVAALLGIIGLYGAWRMTRRPAPAPADTAPFAPILPASTAVALEIAQDVVQEQLAAAEDEAARHEDVNPA